MSQVLFKLQEQDASIVPIMEGKRSIQGWAEFGKKALTKDELQEVIAMEPEGYAIMMGFGGFNCIDIDAKKYAGKHPATFVSRYLERDSPASEI